MSCCQTCSDLGPYRGHGKIKMYVSEIQNSASNGCGNCRLLSDAINSFDREVRASERTEIWCKLSYLPGVRGGARSHFNIDFEEEINASTYSIELFIPLGSFLSSAPLSFMASIFRNVCCSMSWKLNPFQETTMLVHLLHHPPHFYSRDATYLALA